ncbi:MAG: acyl-CoA carboxylase subunit epsilon [Thermomicrobiales bacterium]
MSNQDDRIVLTITPTPSPEELAAITSAVSAALHATTPAAGPQPPEPSRWSRQGRLDAMGGLDEVLSYGST